ncbi:hypothetical protein [Leucobacter sp. VD1]|uniref:hypothetical protein n=1 Tax=Leucobacter sp. VD1 TaxID=3080381 RepID=UPI003019FD8C
MRFALLAGDHAHDFVVIGGLNPDFLATHAPLPHQGTTDIDLLFALGFDDTETRGFSWIDSALQSGGFTSGNKWRWDAQLGDARVRLEFLCDVWDHTADTVPLPGSRLAVGCKLAGPAAALIEPVVRELRVNEKVRDDFPDASDSVALRFASLGGYLIAKAAAAKGRMLPKDKYDFMYVVLYNEGGPSEAGRAVARQLILAEEYADPDEIRWVASRFVGSNSTWASSFAQTMIDTGDESSEEQLVSDAAVGARAFLDALDTE